MNKVPYNPPKIDYKTKKKSLAIPDQSMSIQEIVKRYVKGIPVDVLQRKAIYADQEEEDLEKLARMDFGEKHEYAQALAERAAQIKAELQEMQRSHTLAKHEREAKARDLAAAEAQSKAQKTTT